MGYGDPAGTSLYVAGAQHKAPEFVANPNQLGLAQNTVGNISFPNAAGSGGDVVNKDAALRHFFGQPAKPLDTTTTADQYDIETFDLPDAYRGPNKFIRNILIARITAADTFALRVIAPLKRQDKHLEIQWDQWIFNQVSKCSTFSTLLLISLRLLTSLISLFCF